MAENITLSYWQDFFNYLKDKYVTIIGHDSIDIDSALSGILLSKFLHFLDISNEFCIIEKVKDSETTRVLEKLFNITLNSYENTSESEDRVLFLVDHYETQHSGKVLGCIDHHPTSKEIHYPLYYSKKASSTTYLIYKLMQLFNYPITQTDAAYIITAMMADTVCFRSTKGSSEEKAIAQQLAEKFLLDYDLIENECLCLTPIDKMSIEEILANGEKKYNFNGHAVCSSYIQILGMLEQQTLNACFEQACSKLEASKYELYVFLVFDLANNLTYEYRFTDSKTNILVHDGVLSRGQDIMPSIEKLFE